jgi:hypothetical protein
VGTSNSSLALQCPLRLREPVGCGIAAERKRRRQA